MNIKLRVGKGSNTAKVENNVVIKEVMINEDFTHPSNESIAIGFRAENASGIIELKTGEFEKLVRTVHKKTHLIKSMGLFQSGAIRLN